MCGFITLFERERVFAKDLLIAMDHDLLHRGPDSGGIVSEPGAAMVFRRLAILDPTSQADQPMSDEASGCTLVFNGEIYNFRELREALKQAGRRMRTSGDTEVILQGYLTWGAQIVEKLEGMFAFVLLDRRRKQVLAARDPLGIKPLYVMRRGGLTTFSSEMRPLARLGPVSPDPRALAELVTFRFAAGRLSNLEGIEKVPGGILATLRLDDGNYSERRFCDPLATISPDKDLTREAAIDKAEAGIRASVRSHLQSDVGYTVQLSGGVDSSLIAALVKERANRPVSTFGIRLEDTRYDESIYRAAVVKKYGLDHHEVTLTGKDFAQALPRAVKHMEGPVPHYGCVMLMLMCDVIRDTSKVVLTGEGADEFFGGYKRYGQWRYLRRLGRLAGLVPRMLWPWLQRYRAVQRYAGRDPAIYASVYHDFLALNRLFPELVPEAGMREATCARFGDIRSRMFAVDQSAYLESLLMRQDKMAMAASVEARVPFAHMPLARIVNRFSHEVRAPGGDTKPLLKVIAAKYLPKEVVYRRKVGLGLPLEEWVRDPKLLGRYLHCLTDADSELAAFCDRKVLTKSVERFRRGEPDADRLPMAHLINLELWLRSLSSST